MKFFKSNNWKLITEQDDIIMAVIRHITRMVRDMTTTPADHAMVVAVMMPTYKNTKSSMSNAATCHDLA
jgi:hypothetical protein